MGAQAQGATARAELSMQEALGVLGKGGLQGVAGYACLPGGNFPRPGSGPVALCLPVLNSAQPSAVPVISAQIRESRSLAV